MIIQINPILISSYPNEVFATACKISNINITPYQTATGSIAFGNTSIVNNDSYNELGELVVVSTEVFTPVLNREIELTNAQYLAWGTDDDYVVNTILLNAGVARAKE